MYGYKNSKVIRMSYESKELDYLNSTGRIPLGAEV